MGGRGNDLPWTNAWLAAQAELSRLNSGGLPGYTAADAMGQLRELGGGYAALAAGIWLQAQAQAQSQASVPDLSASFVESYRRLFTSIPTPNAGAATAGPGAAFTRRQPAAQNFSRLAAAIAIDAGGRLAAALDQEGPDAPPITSLRELFELWIECGEAAWAAAARREDFAEAQAELLTALIELRRGQQDR